MVRIAEVERRHVQVRTHMKYIRPVRDRPPEIYNDLTGSVRAILGEPLTAKMLRRRMRRDKAMPSYHGGISDEDKSTSDEEGSATPSLISDPDNLEDTDQGKQANAHPDMRTDPEADLPAGARPVPQRLRSWIMRSPFQDRPEDKEEGEQEETQGEERNKPQQKNCSSNVLKF